MDGARIANACAALNLSLKALTVDYGIDVLSFGGTKNGLMMGECVVIFDDTLKAEARFVRKQSAQLASKMCYLSCQFTAYLTNELLAEERFSCQSPAARRLYEALKKIFGCLFYQRCRAINCF